MIKYLQLPFQFDVPAMQSEVLALSKGPSGTQSDWPMHYQTKHYDGEWSALALRSIDGSAENIVISPVDDAVYHDTELLERSPYLQSVLNSIECPLMAVRLQKLGAGAVIKEHTDMGLCMEQGFLRLHVPVITNDEVEFYLQDEKMQLRQGECWYLNLNLPHALSNKSNTDRIHLVIDGIVNDWVKDLFNSTTISNKKEIADPQPDEATKKQMIRMFREMNTEVGNRMADEMEEQIKDNS
ncbi:MAG TPA: aspartyl/asparaginyl beta-hydroxylase domain-containing protein [Chitinophagaceae bacterium]|jgi:hypothetical protein|nr:aspartyl/asparaginyl beta-hydroxylase domain-containing protein [Chitinophagaceae bacterium]